MATAVAAPWRRCDHQYSIDIIAKWNVHDYLHDDHLSTPIIVDHQFFINLIILLSHRWALEETLQEGKRANLKTGSKTSLTGVVIFQYLWQVQLSFCSLQQTCVIFLKNGIIDSTWLNDSHYLSIMLPIVSSVLASRKRKRQRWKKSSSEIRFITCFFNEQVYFSENFQNLLLLHGH